MNKKLFLIVGLILLVIFVLAGGYWLWTKQRSSVDLLPSNSNDEITKLAASLDQQKILKKFSSPEEIKDFFAARPNNSANNFMVTEQMARVGDVANKAAPAATGLGAGPASGFSTTNVQVAGVDEADLVKTDGQYIYQANGDKINIIKAMPVTDASVISTIKAPGNVQEIYLSADRLIAFGYDYQLVNRVDKTMMIRPSPYVFLNVYDLSDQTKPELLKTWRLEGSYISSRLINNHLYFITTAYNFYPLGDFILPKVFIDQELISSEKNSERYSYPEVYYVDAATSYNATTVSVIKLDDLARPFYSQLYFMPSSENVYASTNNLYLTYTKYLSDYQLRMSVAKELLFSRLNSVEQNRINEISQINSAILSEDEKAVKINQVIDAYFYRLAEGERMNLLKQLDEEFTKRYQALYEELEKTVVHKIKLDNGNLVYGFSNEVSGRILNQYSLDEYNNYFRLATTRSQGWVMPLGMSWRGPVDTIETEQSYNNIYVLDEQLKLVGEINNLARGERIYSVRFINDQAYVVTFKQIDPLFVIDLAEPTQPTVAGELKIPGFSNYLHPYKDNWLIGIGKETIDNGEQGITIKGLKLSLFDVSDPAKPQEVSQLILGGPGSDSSALYDYKAFTFIPDKDLFVIPMSLNNLSAYQLEFQGLGVFKIENNKLSELGRVYHPLSEEQKKLGYSFSEPIQRGLYINDYLYSTSNSLVGIYQLADLAKIKFINLPMADKPIDIQPMPVYEEVIPQQ